MENSLNQNKVWGWGELALMYFPNISQKSATMQLLKWIRAGILVRKTSPPDKRITLWDISENPEEVKVER